MNYEYEARQKDIRDHNYLINQAKREGKQEGIREGKQEGIEQIARNLLSMGLNIEQVAKGTELSIAEVSKLKEELTTLQ